MNKIITATNRLNGQTATIHAKLRVGTNGRTFAEISKRQLFEVRTRLNIYPGSIDPSLESPKGWGDFEPTEEGGYSAIDPSTKSADDAGVDTCNAE